MEHVIAYKTKDGKIFDTRQEAIAYEVTLATQDMVDTFIRANALNNPEEVRNLLLLWAAFSKEEAKNRSIHTLSFNVRTLNCLLAENITTIVGLLKYSENDLLKTPNLGRKSLNEIKDVLLGNGWQLSATSINHAE